MLQSVEQAINEIRNSRTYAKVVEIIKANRLNSARRDALWLAGFLIRGKCSMR